MATLSKDQVRQIISDAPSGTSPEGIISGLRAKGHVLEGYEAATPTAASLTSGGFGTKQVDTKTASLGEESKFDERGRRINRGKNSGLLSRMSETLHKQGDKFKAIKERVTTPKEGQFLGQNPLSTGIQVVGTGIGTVAELGMDVLEEITPDPIKEAGTKALQFGLKAALGEKGYEALPEIAAKYETWAEKNPQAAADLSGFIEIAGILPVGRGAKLGVEGAELAAKKGAQVASKKLSTGATEMLAKREAATLAKIDHLTGSIVQGKTKDIDPAVRALKELDTTGIKTYEELTEAAGNEIGTLSTKVDEAFALNTKPVKLVDLAKKVESKSGKRSIEQNFVDDAMKHLEELYKKTGDPEGLLRVQDLRDKAVAEGLLAKEINDLSREYGKEFGRKAFSKVSGDPLTSVNAVKFENVRKGIKDSARNLLDDDAAKIMDKQMSDLFTLKKNTEKMVEKVNQLTQKIKKRGTLEKLGRGLAIGADTLTGGALRGFMQKILLQSNIGLKAMNSLDIEAALKKNLRNLDKLLDSSDDNLVDGLLNMIKENADEAGTTVEAVTAAALEGVDDALPKAKAGGVVPPAGGAIERIPGLSDDLNKLQEQSIKQYEADPIGLRDKYLLENKKLVNTDEARSLFNGYNGRNAIGVHEASSKLSKDAYAHLLKTGEGDTVVFMAGGAGSGKSTAGNIDDLMARSDINSIMDGTAANYKSTVRKIEAAQAAGKQVETRFVMRDPLVAWKRGVVPRSITNGRVVPISVHFKDHKSSLESIIRLADEKPGASIKFVDNTGGPGEAVTTTLDKVREMSNTLSEETINSYIKQGQDYVKELQRAGKIDAELAKALLE